MNNQQIRSANSSKESNKVMVTKSKINDESQNNSQKDVIVRKIKKKNEASKTASHSSLGFGHK